MPYYHSTSDFFLGRELSRNYRVLGMIFQNSLIIGKHNKLLICKLANIIAPTKFPKKLGGSWSNIGSLPNYGPIQKYSLSSFLKALLFLD